MSRPVRIIASLALSVAACGRAAGFGVAPAIRSPRAFAKSSRSTSLFAIRCEEKYYQLEEMEDASTSTTELYLREDHSVVIGQTDGPVYLDAFGEWNVKPGTDDFTMVIKRTYGTGSDGKDMGEFTYELARTYVGEMTKVGESVGITGVTHTLGPTVDGDKEVGFFNMIDGTKERDSYGKEAEEEEEPKGQMTSGF